MTTRWSVIAACRQTNQAQAREALSELCQAYWQPVYVCIRHRGHSPHDAEDLTQTFFLRVLNGSWLEHLDEAKGRFRVYLSVALRNFLHDQWRRRWTLRRGRGTVVVPLEGCEAENSYALIPATQRTPESLYELQWARAVFYHALEQLKIELRADGKEVLFSHFDAIFTADTPDFPYVEVAQALGQTSGALHSTLYRWRQRFQGLMREEIARTVVSKTEVDDELRHLQRVFAQAE